MATQAVAPIDLNGLKVVDVGDPTNPQDAATKAYVDLQTASDELITGDNSNFNASLGDWTTTGGVITRDFETVGGFISIGGVSASLHAAIEANDYAELAIPGTFTADTLYDCLIVYSVEEAYSSGRTLSFLFGDIAAGDSNQGDTGGADLREGWGGGTSWAAYRVTWKPTANRTAVKVRVLADASTIGTLNVRLGWVRATPVGDGPGYAVVPHPGTLNRVIVPHINGSGTIIGGSPNTVTQVGLRQGNEPGFTDARHSAVHLNSRGVDLYGVAGGIGEQQTSQPGIALDVSGDDENVVGAVLSMSSLTVAQFMPETTNDVHLKDITTNARRWRAVNAAGTKNVPLSDAYYSGGTDIPVADGGTGASDAATARTNLGITAVNVPFTPAGTIAATTVQAAIEEVAAEAGGSGLPPEWTVGSNGAVIAEVDDVDETPLTLQAMTGQVDHILKWFDENGVLKGNIDFEGTLDTVQIAVQVPPDVGGDAGSIALNGATARITVTAGPDLAAGAVMAQFGTIANQFFSIKKPGLGADNGYFETTQLNNADTMWVMATSAAPESDHFQLWNGNFDAKLFRITKGGAPGTSATAVADAELAAGEMVLFFDPTNAAADLVVKGKTANGTVVSQEFPVGLTAQTYTESNVTTDRTFNANATTLDELADVLGTLIADLRAKKIVA